MKRALAIWPWAVVRPEKVLEEAKPPEEIRAQEENKLLNSQAQPVESSQERIQRLVPGLEVKRLIL